LSASDQVPVVGFCKSGNELLLHGVSYLHRNKLQKNRQYFTDSKLCKT